MVLLSSLMAGQLEKGACFLITSKYSWISEGSESLADCILSNKECAFAILVQEL